MEQQINYQIKSSLRTRHIRIAVYPDGQVVVTKPYRISAAYASQFVNRKSSWIQKKLNFYKNRKVLTLAPVNLTKSEALGAVIARVNFLNQHYHFPVGKISLKNHKSLWGSCSRRKNLNFNNKILQLPPEHMDYIIVHELCHLQEFNHSRRFWDLVAETVPNFKALKKDLKNYSFQ